MTCTAWLTAAVALAAMPTAASPCPPPLEPGRLVGVSIEIDGRPAPLLPSRDGSGRWYLEARRGSAYAVRLVNRTASRLGVELRVDGLDVISGEAPPEHGRGRLYILSPGGSTLVRGWRRSLDAVQRFEFVDEERSYAARAQKSGARPGWIEARVFRELRTPVALGEAVPPATPRARGADEAENAARPEASQEGRARSYPGTGWGERLGDRAVVVEFDAEPFAAETLALRYEYADALLALGLLEGRCDPWQRLRERERGEAGFAQPPRH